MFENQYRNIFFEAKTSYKAIRVLTCPALDNEAVYFSRKGFEHLIRKGRKIRPISDQVRRFRLLKHIRIVMKHARLVNSRVATKKIRFWTISHNIGDINIKVVICQEGNGKKHFLSIM